MPRPMEFDREKALDAAMHTFWCKGYTATSMDDLKSAMGIRPGSLYNTFKDKHTLFLEALDRYQRTEGGYVFVPLDEMPSGLQAIQQVFADLIEQEIADPQQRGCFMVNAALELAAHDPEVKEIATQSRTATEGAFLRALQRAQASGEIGTFHDLGHLAAFLTSLVYGVRATAKTQLNRDALVQMVEVGLSILR